MVTTVFCSVYLFLISLCDIRYLKIPNGMLVALFTSVFCSDISHEYGNIIERLLCALLFGLFLFFIAAVTKGLGAGDIKLMTVIGYCYGFIKGLLILGTAVIGGMLFCLFYCSFRKRTKIIPFAPFIFLGFLFTQVFFSDVLCIFVKRLY